MALRRKLGGSPLGAGPPDRYLGINPTSPPQCNMGWYADVHEHTHAPMSACVYACVCVFVCVCACMCVRVHPERWPLRFRRNWRAHARWTQRTRTARPLVATMDEHTITSRLDAALRC